jgi:hypothetical protein
MSTLTLRNGTRIDFSHRRFGTVITLPSGERVGGQEFLLHLAEATAESGASIAALMERFRIPDDGTCWMCESGQLRTLCPECGCIARCDACAVEHDDSPICRQTREAADLHRRIRGGDTIEPQDRYAAIKLMASSYLRRVP